MILQIAATVKNSLKSKPYLYLLILLVQTVSLLCVFFSCGLIYNAFTEFKEASLENRCIRAVLINRYDESLSDDEKYGGGLSYDVFQSGLEDVIEKLGDNRAKIQVDGIIKIDGRYYGVQAWHDTGEGSGGKYGPYDIMVKGYEAGDYINIDGIDYRVVKEPEVSSLFFPAGTKVPPSVVPIEVGIELERQPTYSECEAIVDEIEAKFNPISIAEPEVLELLEVQMSNSQIALSAVLLVIVTLNCGICYNYINNSRRKQFAVYKLCGARVYHCYTVSMAEVALYMLLGFALAYLIFEHSLKGILTSFYPNITGVYTESTYKYILAAYALFSLIIMSVSIIKYAQRPIVEERKQL